jgi:hypothetical protein
MNDTKLRTLVDEAVNLDREITEKQDRLKEIKSTLVNEAESREDDLQPIGEDGRGITFAGHEGCVARVCFPSPALKSKINGETPAGAKVIERLGRFKDELLTPVLSYEPVSDFRERCRALFQPREAAKIIAACEGKSSPRVSFETKEVEAVP